MRPVGAWGLLLGVLIAAAGGCETRPTPRDPAADPRTSDDPPREASADVDPMAAARRAAEAGDFAAAVDALDRVSEEDPLAWTSARRAAAEILHRRLHRLSDAEAAYRDVLKNAPDDVAANDGLARLMAAVGRREAAIPPVLRLVRAGVESDLVVLLAYETGGVDETPLLESARAADPSDPLPLIGLARIAQLRQDPARALRLLKLAAEMPRRPPGFHGLLGRQLLDNGRLEELSGWAAADEAAFDSAEAYLVRAEVAERSGDEALAERSYVEAIRLAPESVQANVSLARLLSDRGEDDAAARFADHAAALTRLRDAQRAVMSGSAGGAVGPPVYALVEGYERTGRLWEAFAWGHSALQAQPRDRRLAGLVASLRKRVADLPLSQTDSAANPATGFQLPPQAGARPGPRSTASGTQTDPGDGPSPVRFREDAADIGFRFTYDNGADGDSRRTYEFGGGGIAAFDYDRDGRVDVFCTQGGPGPNSAGGDGANDTLFRGLGGRFVEASTQAGLSGETGFGQGVAAGDFNNDGFADLYVANAGGNVLWLGNGDGTFSPVPLPSGRPRWTTSCVIADITGDGTPDLYDVNYLAGEDVFERVCRGPDGRRRMCTPYVFEGETDRLLVGDGRGGFRDGTAAMSPPPRGKGLGVVVIGGPRGRPSLVVANDTTPNFWYVRPDGPPAGGPDDARLEDVAVLSGLAYNGRGKAEAGMGIAAADVTGDGLTDLHVTNFLHESNTLYVRTSPDGFRDATADFALRDVTRPVLGFGTQFVDADLDGRAELFVANGNTQDLRHTGVPYAMRPQMFALAGGRARELAAETLGPWAAVESVSRAAARCDWNADGRPDLVVGRLHTPTVVLTNTSDTGDNRFLSLELVAVRTARDAVGAVVTVTAGDLSQTHEVTAGDGYQCSNERRLLIGCGAADAVTLRVRWPSGGEQTFERIGTARRLTLVEGGRPVAEP